MGRLEKANGGGDESACKALFAAARSTRQNPRKA